MLYCGFLDCQYGDMGCAPVKFASLLFFEKFNRVKVAGYGFLGSWFLVRSSGLWVQGKCVKRKK
jgi:hypothetical protein